MIARREVKNKNKNVLYNIDVFVLADPIIAGQRNSLCMGRNNETGTCQSRRTCNRNSGMASGQCGIASGVCCTRKNVVGCQTKFILPRCIYNLGTLKPNDSSQLKRTTMRRPIDRSITEFVYKITPMNSRICQVWR